MKKKLKNLLNIIKKKIKSINKRDIIIFMIPLIMFGIYWVAFYPGVLSYDSYNQLSQIESMTFNSAHPFFHTFIEMVLMRIWNTPAVVGLFQILVFSILWTSICKYNRKEDNKLLFLYQVAFTIIIALNPLNKVISITLWKDVLYSYMILWFCFELEKMIFKKFKITTKDVFKLSFLLILIPSLRHNGYIITLFMGILLLILFIIKDRKSKNYLKFIGLLIIFFFSFKGLEKIYNVKEELNIGQTGSIIDYKLLSLSGEIGREGKVSEKQEETINKYVIYDNVKRHVKYNALDALWIVCEPDSELISKEHGKFLNLVFGMVKNNVGVTIKYLFKETSFIWRIVRYDDSWGIINYMGIKADNTDNAYVRPLEDSILYEALNKYVSFTRENKLFQTLFYSGSLCLYISIISLIYLRKKHKFNGIIILLPILFNLAGLILTMPDNDVRYYYSNFLVYYLIVIVLLKYWVGEDEKKKPKEIRNKK